MIESLDFDETTNLFKEKDIKKEVINTSYEQEVEMAFDSEFDEVVDKFLDTFEVIGENEKVDKTDEKNLKRKEKSIPNTLSDDDFFPQTYKQSIVKKPKRKKNRKMSRFATQLKFNEE